MSNCRILWVHALTPVHVGSGFGVGAVDLPIVREKTTNWPYYPGSGLKGVLADFHNASGAGQRDPLARVAFGAADRGDELEGSNAGSLVIGDAKLVLFPVRSLLGTWAWLTCPLALRRLLRDLEQANLTDQPGMALPAPGMDQVLLPQQPNSKLQANRKVFVSDLDLQAIENTEAMLWANKLSSWLFPSPAGATDWAPEFLSRFGIVHDDMFNYLLETGIEVATRVRIDQSTGAVAKGQLWTEEALPAESVLASLVWVDKVRLPGATTTQEELLGRYCSAEIPSIQIGGKATVGRGLVRGLFAGR